MMRSLIIIIISFNCFSLSAQTDSVTVSGKILAAIDSELIPIKTALILNKRNRTGVQASEDGSFSFKQPTGKVTFEVTDFGYDRVDTTIILTQNTRFDMILKPDCEINRTTALKDIKKKKARLLLAGGIAPIRYSNQNKFERKYKTAYFDFGCVVPANECIVSYNLAVFEHLDKTFGVKWRDEVRQDVIGLNEE